MHRPPAISLFLQTLSAATLVITYRALPGEIDLSTIPYVKDFLQTRVQIELPQDPHQDPVRCAQEIIKKYSSAQAVIFVPGQAFDLSGTRHGRGGGWYDRFLSQLPSPWIRVGVTDRAHLSNQTLIREPWDELMDWILCWEGDGFSSSGPEFSSPAPLPFRPRRT